MNLSYTEAHTTSAIDLYELRQSWLTETDIHANAFEGVEERLCASLYHCASSLQSVVPDNAETDTDRPEDADTPEPKTEAECFVFLASHLISTQAATRNAGYDLAHQWLTQDAAKSAAAEASLSLYPQLNPIPPDNTPLLKLYEEQEALRPTVLRLIRKQMQALPIALINTAATAETSTAALKGEALAYAAARPEIGPDIFRTHYQPLLTGKTQFDAAVIEAAIWGGMLRGDADATRAISAALTHISTAKERASLLRLAALSGAAEFLPLLLQACENDPDPDTGYYLLTLYGQKSVMPELLRAMENAHTIEAAATAFNQLSDHLLPRIPRLTVVGETADDEEADDEDTPEHIPDIKAARTWWDNNQANWKTDERWLAGRPTTVPHLQAFTQKYAGSLGRDVMARLALAQKAPLNIASDTWRARQYQLLAEQSAAKPANNTASKPAGKAAAKPARTQHA